MGFDCRYDPCAGVVELWATGHVSRDAVECALLLLHQVSLDGRVRILEVVDGTPTTDPALAWPRMNYNFDVLVRVTHVAIVSDIGWISPITKAVGALISSHLRTFGRDDLQPARAWLARADKAPFTRAV